MTAWDFDIVVAGAGPVALAFAAGMAGTGLRIALLDPQPEAVLADPPDDGREIALTDRSVSSLDTLGAWSLIPPASVSPLRHMRVLNGASRYAMHFGGGAAPNPDGLLGRFVPNHALRRALHRRARALPGVFILPGQSATAMQATRDGAILVRNAGAPLRAGLVVAADTRRSRLRAQQRIGALCHDYRQRMLVCPVTHERSHDDTATAWFEYGRTLVTLPMNNNRSSAVMTLPNDDADAMLALDDAAFGVELTRRYRGRLGTMRPDGGRHAVPVFTAYASRFVGRRFALLGDAAVGMHPTTAHGFNFGLLGAAALATALRGALEQGREVADAGALSAFEAAHRAETRLFFGAAETLMRLYAGGEALPARLLRDGALRIGNLPPVRRMLEARMREPDDAHAGRPGVGRSAV
ncbi:FAD-dependent monooxygenase [Rhizosaccharibacter radicis]|uniref:FAD-dependent monooxygenase n=1 Tax=Rhizosaccharibacter radicis TaxID=2782605 RepID=A0ABT1VT16_9PROT|nr:FAD-dependent monooxygenase [Acetobacteraceae bacterium KSS12]